MSATKRQTLQRDKDTPSLRRSISMPVSYWQAMDVMMQAERREDRSEMMRRMVEDAAVEKKVAKLQGGRLVLSKGAAK